MTISEFKAKCIAVLKDVQASGEGILVTHRGKPIARVEPFSTNAGPRPLGALSKRMQILTDLVAEESRAEWEMESGSTT